MLILEAKAKEGTTVLCYDYALRATVSRPLKSYDYKPVGKTEYEEGTTVKQALSCLAGKGELYGSAYVPFLEWLADKTEDAQEGEELASPVNPTIYRLRRI